MGILGVLFSSGFGHLKCFCKNKLLNDLVNIIRYFYLILDFLKLILDT